MVAWGCGGWEGWGSVAGGRAGFPVQGVRSSTVICGDGRGSVSILKPLNGALYMNKLCGM